MDEVNKKECGCGEGKCGCGPMGPIRGCPGRKCHLVKVILKLVILIIIFWCGFKLGQMTGFIQAGYGHTNYGMMRGGYSLPNGGGVPAPVTPAP